MKRINSFILVAFLFLACFQPISSPAASIPHELPLDTMIGQMIMVGFKGTGQGPLTPEMALLLEDIRRGLIGGVILFDRDWQTKKRGRNVINTSQVTSLAAMLQKSARIPLFIAVDQEGGRVQRLRPDHGFAATPSAADLGRGTTEGTRMAAKTMGNALRKAGITVNFAPVADIAVNPDSPAISRLDRAFSGDVEKASRHAAAFAQGLGSAKIASCYKHFPGHGSAVADTHLALTDITATWREEELLPYTRGNLPENIPLMVMTGHLMHAKLDPKYPASLSWTITTGLLREKLGWQGVVVTDDLEMAAVSQFYSMEERIRLAIEAGVDIILFGNNIQYHPEQGRRIHEIIARLTAEGMISPDRIAESWQRIRSLKEKLR